MTDKFLSQDSTSTDIFDDIAATRQKLGLVPGTTIQSHNSKLDALSGLSLSSGKILKATGTNTFSLLNVSTHGENALNSNSVLLSKNANEDITGVKTIKNDLVIDDENTGDLLFKKSSGSTKVKKILQKVKNLLIRKEEKRKKTNR